MSTETPAAFIVEDSAGAFWRVRNDARYDHAYIGVRVNARTHQPTKGAREILVRKACTRLVETV